jgi:lysophospholipase L1-like esterase
VKNKMKANHPAFTLGVVLCLLLTRPAGAQTNGAPQRAWVGTWVSSPEPAAKGDLPPNFTFNDATIRQVVHTSVRGKRIRVRFSNAFGTQSVTFTTARVALSAGASVIKSGTDHQLLFDRRSRVTIPAGAMMVSDPIDFELPPLADVAITVHVEDAPLTITSHPGSRTTSYLLKGNSVWAVDLPDTTKIDRWYFINGIDILGPTSSGSVVVLGDSITDGRGSTANGNDRWPDQLSRRLQAQLLSVGVLNQGIGGNRLLRDGLGPNALARFDRDVIAQAGVRWLIILEGVNDLGTRKKAGESHSSWATAEDMLQAYSQMIVRAHAHGIKVYGGTITPLMESSYSAPDVEADRQKVNEWIRTSGSFDGVIDFDRSLRDPAHPDQLLPAFDSGDHLHPSPAGYMAMANAVPVAIFGAEQQVTSRIAFTFDDLPAHGVLPAGESRLDVASKIIAALRQAGLPPVYGFINGERVEENPADEAVLQAWRAAGNPLGNHTWSHMNLNQHTMEDFAADIAKNEPVLKKTMGTPDWHWFRFPFLAEGDTPQKHAAVRQYLADHHYKVAAVTMSFGDYMWNEPYARCKDKGDENAVAMLKATYLAAADASIAYDRELSHTLFGRDIPYVLLMHIGALDAEMLPQLLDLYRSRGFRFVTLADAEQDSWYRPETSPGLPSETETLEGTMRARHLAPPSYMAPAVPFNTICR